jgi:hypothetical protein
VRRPKLAREARHRDLRELGRERAAVRGLCSWRVAVGASRCVTAATSTCTRSRSVGTWRVRRRGGRVGRRAMADACKDLT